MRRVAVGAGIGTRAADGGFGAWSKGVHTEHVAGDLRMERESGEEEHKHEQQSTESHFDSSVTGVTGFFKPA